MTKQNHLCRSLTITQCDMDINIVKYFNDLRNLFFENKKKKKKYPCREKGCAQDLGKDLIEAKLILGKKRCKVKTRTDHVTIIIDFQVRCNTLRL